MTLVQRPHCKGICEQYKARKPTSGGRYASGQVRCQVCEIYLIPDGAKDGKCRCCNYNVRSKPRNKLYKEKYHDAPKIKPGRPNRKVENRSNTKKKLLNANLFVTLEPCTHYGKTEPCVKQITKEKIKKVYYSIPDIDIRTANKSKKILRKKKIIVNIGLNKNNIKNFYRFYYKNKKKKLPYITCKLAVSKDGFIKNTRNKNITNYFSRKISHILRAKNDAILISVKTLIDDNPLLTCRINGIEKFSPIRIILDKDLTIPISSKIVLTSKKYKTIIFYNKKRSKKIKILKKKGIRLIYSILDKDKKFNLNKIFKKIYQLNLSRLLIEGGYTLTKYIIDNYHLDEFYLFRTGDILGSNGKINVNNILNKINRLSKNKRSIISNLKKDKLFNYKF